MDAIESVTKALGKVPEKNYYRIGEVARVTGVKPYVLRYWETEFKAIVPPKSRSQQRMYRRKDIANILLIKHLLYKERFTIEGARKRLTELARGGDAAKATKKKPSAAAAADPSPDVLPLLRRLRGELEHVRARLAEA